MIKRLLISAIATVALTGCNSDADIVSRNLSTAADNFEISRRIVFYNGITDAYILTIEGKCSIDTKGASFQVTCKTSPTEYKKHFLGLSDNVTYFAEQLQDTTTSTYHYKVMFKPQATIPGIELKYRTKQ